MRRLIARSPLLAVLAAVSALLVPAAVAWACAPQALVRTDKLSYNPGEQMTVSGRDFFFSGTSVTITTDPAGAYAEGVPVTPAGTFETQLAAPEQPGSYTLIARGSNYDGRTAFVVNTPPKQCSDGQDNDGDGRTDYPRDPGCSSANDDNESNPPPPVSSRPPANPCTIHGTGGNDVLRGTSGADVICAAGGNDVIYGRGGNDVIRGGSGNDILYGNGGADSLHTQDARRGNDVARGGAGADSCATDPLDVRSSC